MQHSTQIGILPPHPTHRTMFAVCRGWLGFELSGRPLAVHLLSRMHAYDELRHTEPSHTSHGNRVRPMGARRRAAGAAQPRRAERAAAGVADGAGGAATPLRAGPPVPACRGPPKTCTSPSCSPSGTGGAPGGPCPWGCKWGALVFEHGRQGWRDLRCLRTLAVDSSTHAIKGRAGFSTAHLSNNEKACGGMFCYDDIIV